MKKLIQLLLVGILSVSMAACGNTTTQDPAGDTNQDSATVYETEVLVIGAGGAGLAAAAGAGEQGAKVIVLEAAGFAGGAAMVSGGHMAMLHEEMNAAAERNDADLGKYLDYKEEDFGEWAPSLTVLKQQVTDYLASDTPGRFDSVERMIVDHYVTGKGKDLDGVEVYQNYELVKEGLEANWEIFEWLTSGGMQIKNSFYKVHANNPVDGGLGLANALINLAEKAGAEIVLNTTATELIMENDKAVGVKAIDKDGNEVIYRASKGVILATGSFSSNGEMCAKYQRIGEGLTANNPSNNVGTNKGAGILMAEAVGAELRDMQFMMTVLRGYNGGCTLSQSGKITGKQQLVVNSDAVRYGDETSGKFSSMTNNQEEGIAYYVGDAKMIAAINDADAEFLESMKDRGFIFIADTLEEAATAAGLDAETLKATVETFNSYVDAGEDKDFGRTKFNGKVEEGQYIIAKMQMYYHLTYGGLVTDTEAQVLDTNGNWINGLYAAGDVTCGFEGAAHQSGDCLSIVVYYGRVAGQNAANSK